MEALRHSYIAIERSTSRVINRHGSTKNDNPWHLLRGNNQRVIRVSSTFYKFP